MAILGEVSFTESHTDNLAKTKTFASISTLAGNTSEPMQFTVTLPNDFATARLKRLSGVTINAATAHVNVINLEGGWMDVIRSGKLLTRFVPSSPTMRVAGTDPAQFNANITTWTFPLPFRVQPGDILRATVPPGDDSGSPSADLHCAIELDDVALN